jgi:alpha/beta superfamily hydrolase
LYGGSIEVPVVTALFRALVACGHGVLAFNWRGIGASDGSASGELRDAEQDYCAAVDHAAADRPFTACGYSWGAAAALAVASRTPRAERLILVAPPVAVAHIPTLAQLARPAHIIVGSNDAFAPVEAIERWMAGAHDGKLSVIDGADHFFAAGGTDEIERLVAAHATRL